MNRAYSFLTVKDLDREQRRISGWASRPEVDRAGDIVEPMGLMPAKGTINLLLDHDHSRAVGVVESVQPSSDGVRFTARIAKISQAGALKSMCDDAWEMVREKLRAAVSIGFMPHQAEPMPSGGYRFKSWSLLELSLVSVPACESATIDSIKSYDRTLRQKANTGGRVVRLSDVPRGVATLANANTGGRVIADAMLKAAARVEADAERLRDLKALGTPHMILNDALTAGANATDKGLAEIQARVARLEGKA